MKRSISCLLAALALLLCSACGGPEPGASPSMSPVAQPASEGPFTVSSPAVTAGAMDAEYGARGTLSHSLPQESSGAPEGTRAYALLVEDPDSVPVAGYVCEHWLAANIATAALPAGASLELSEEMVQGKNYLGTAGYTGPAPPQGETHRYVVTVWALDAALPLENGFDRAALTAALEGHVLASAELTAAYSNF